TIRRLWRAVLPLEKVDDSTWINHVHGPQYQSISKQIVVLQPVDNPLGRSPVGERQSPICQGRPRKLVGARGFEPPTPSPPDCVNGVTGRHELSRISTSSD